MPSRSSPKSKKGEKEKYVVPSPKADSTDSSRKPPPGAAPPEQWRNPTFGDSPKKKHHSGGRHKKSKRHSSSSGIFSLRTIWWLISRCSIIYIIYAAFSICPADSNASSLCGPIDSIKDTLKPVYDVHIYPYIDPYADTITLYYNKYGRPITRFTYALSNKGRQIYFKHAHPVVLNGYTTTLKPSVDHYTTILKDRYATHVEPTVKEFTDKVHSEYVQPAVAAAAPHVSKGVEFAKPYAKAAGEITVDYVNKGYEYSAAYVGPSARQAGNSVTSFWRTNLSPVVDSAWQQHIAPASVSFWAMLKDFVDEDDTLVVEETNEAGEWLASLLQGIRKFARTVLRNVVQNATRFYNFVFEDMEEEKEEIIEIIPIETVPIQNKSEENARELRALVEKELANLDRIVEKEIANFKQKIDFDYLNTFNEKLKTIIDQRQSELFEFCKSEVAGFKSTIDKPEFLSLEAPALRSKLGELVNTTCERLENARVDVDKAFREITDSIVTNIQSDGNQVKKIINDTISAGYQLINQNKNVVDNESLKEEEKRIADSSKKAHESADSAIESASNVAQEIKGLRHQRQHNVIDLGVRNYRKRVREIAEESESFIKKIEEEVKEKIFHVKDKIEERFSDNKEHVGEEIETIKEAVEEIIDKVIGQD